MDQYIIQTPRVRRTYLLWISAFLLIFNVYHTKLMSLLSFPSSPASIMAVQGFALALLLVYFLTAKKLKLQNIAIQPIEWLLILTLLVMLVTTESVSENLTYMVRYAVLVFLVILMKYDENVITFIRKTDKSEETLLAVCNFAGIPYKDYQTGVPFAGKYKEIFNSDDKKYGGEGKTNPRM